MARPYEVLSGHPIGGDTVSLPRASKEAVFKLADALGVPYTYEARCITIHMPKGDRQYRKFVSAYNYLQSVKRSKG